VSSNHEKQVDAIQGEIIHVYDGIQEADNHLPTWWLTTLFGAMVFSVGYWFWYEEFKASPGIAGEYFAEKAAEQAKTGADPDDNQLMAQLGTPAVAAGKATFTSNCVACHEAQGQGKIGPNLTDAAWLHGGSPSDIYKTIKNGVAAKGMPAWGPTLGSASVQALTAYVLSIRDTNVPGKAPEGEAYAPGGAAPAAPADKPAELPAGATGAAAPQGEPNTAVTASK
jgi:cytochrome c oxidase cbb3-type subunit III